MKPGDKVILNVPENPRIHGSPAYIFLLEEWGAHVATRATATGHFRAHWSEMEQENPTQNAQPDYTGDQCHECGSMSLVRTGSCLTCQQCGWNGGCG